MNELERERWMRSSWRTAAIDAVDRAFRADRHVTAEDVVDALAADGLIRIEAQS